jgi:hypothetical protein
MSESPRGKYDNKREKGGGTIPTTSSRRLSAPAAGALQSPSSSHLRFDLLSWN